MKVLFCYISIFGMGLLFSGCFAKVYRLPPQTSGQPVFQSIEEQNALIGLAISGGGSRAATFTSGVIEAMAELSVTEGSQKISVLEKVNYLSSVSGGSLAAAYYAAKKPPKEVHILENKGISKAYQEFFETYKADMQQDFQRKAFIRQSLFFRGFNPTKSAYSFSEVWDRAFFHEVNFSDLYNREQRGDSPRLILNGTLYNNGRRFLLTTLSQKDFDYDLLQLEKETHDQGAKNAQRQLLPLTFEGMNGNYKNLPISLAVATSASFPPLIGPVTYSIEGQPPYSHIGDGGLFDNLGIESLAQLFLNKMTLGSLKKGLIVVIDTSYPFDVRNDEMDKSDKGFNIFVEDPSRISGIMEERAISYQHLLWHFLRGNGGGGDFPGPDRFQIVSLRYTNAEWGGYDDLPSECRSTFSKNVTSSEIKQTISQIPTRFKIKSCDGALLIKAAHKVVEKHKDQILDFIASFR
jgi:predicted acylesterase/phospholipase RssA